MGLSQSEIPAQVSGIVQLADGSIKPVFGHPHDFPAYLVLPLFNKTPTLWLTDSAGHKPVRHYLQRLIYKPNDPSPFDSPSVGMNYEFDPEPYQRMLAKIALGAAFLKYGTGHFTPLVCDFIRGIEKNAIGKYIFGYDLNDKKQLITDAVHYVLVRELEYDGVQYIIAFVRLFAVYDAPTNGVIVGIIE